MDDERDDGLTVETCARCGSPRNCGCGVADFWLGITATVGFLVLAWVLTA